jgi:hypothetical protein
MKTDHLHLLNYLLKTRFHSFVVIARNKVYYTFVASIRVVSCFQIASATVKMMQAVEAAELQHFLPSSEPRSSC